MRKRKRIVVLCWETLPFSDRLHTLSLLCKQIQVKAFKIQQKHFPCISLCAKFCSNFITNILTSFQIKMLRVINGIKVTKQNWGYAKINHTPIRRNLIMVNVANKRFIRKIYQIKGNKRYKI